MQVKMQIKRLIFIEMGTYSDMMLRPYSIGGNLTRTALMNLQETTRGGANLTSSNLAGLAGQLLRPSTEVEGVAQIANNWDTQRFAFLMEVAFPDPFGGVKIQYLSGYTNHVGISQNGHFDPNMHLYFNNSIETRLAPALTSVGNMMEQRVTSASHLLTGEYQPSFGNLHNVTHTMRPQDVFSSYQGSGLADYDADILDTRTTFSEGRLRKSIRANTSAPTYLSRLLSTHHAEVSCMDESTTYENMLGEAAGVVREPTLTSDAFIHQLSIQTRLMQGGYIAYSELCHVAPETNHIAEVILRSGVHRGELHQRGQTSHWHGGDHETIMATILSHAVPALMAENMLMVAGFTATNRNIGNVVTIGNTAAQSFAQHIDMRPYLASFNYRLEHEVLRDLSQNGLIDYYIDVHFDMIGQTVIKIAVGANPLTEFTNASFADAMFVPVLTNTQHTLQKLAGDVMQLAESFNTDYSPYRRYAEPAHGTIDPL